jgi:tetratricopeptide (TPR) repeat protein
MRFLVLWLAAVALVALDGPAHAAWYEAKSKHFIIYSDDKPERITRFAERLERFDAAVRFVRRMSDPPLTDSARLRVYVLRSEGAVAKLIGDRSARGMYEARMSGAVSFVPRSAGGTSDWDLDTEEIFFHEYAHHLQLQFASAAMPEWVVEGFAEFFATAKIERDGSVLLGSFPAYRSEAFVDDGGLTLEQMLGGTYTDLNDAQTNALYGRGWMLMHLLSFSNSRAGQLDRYLDGIQKGMSPLESARAAFGDLRILKKELNSYGRVSLAGLRVPAKDVSIGPVALRQLTAGETAIMPIHIRSTRGVTDKEAPEVAAEARRVAQSYPRDPFVQTALAEAEYDADDYSATEAAADRALAADPRYVRALIYKGRAQMALAIVNRGSANWANVRSWFLKANKLDTENPEPLALFYRTFDAAGEKPTRNAVAALLYSVILAPQDEGLRLMAVRELLVENRGAEAKTMLAPLAYQPHSDAEFRDAMLKLMSAISSGDTKAALLLMDEDEKNVKNGAQTAAN